MPKKANDQKAKARKLFEEKGLTLAAISKQLDIKDSTIRNWKARDKQKGDEWVKKQSVKNETKNEKKGKRRKRNVSPKSLANLKPPIKPGEQRALKHGFYANHWNNPEYVKLFEELQDMDQMEVLKIVGNQLAANIIMGQEKLDLKDPNSLNSLARAAAGYSGMVKNYFQMEDMYRRQDTEAEEKMDALIEKIDIESMEDTASVTEP